jgi:RNA polymerase sigma-70 factor (ECF subfamily)
MPKPVVRTTIAAASLQVSRAAAFEALAEQRIYESYKLANAILASPQAAEDAVHDAFVKAWQRWPSLRDPVSLDAWFKRIVINTCRDRLRWAKHREYADIDAETEVATPDLAHAIHERVRVQQALTRLKPDDRILLALRYYEDLKLDDIATLLGVPIGTVKSRLNAAHGRLRSALARSGEARR